MGKPRAGGASDDPGAPGQSVTRARVSGEHAKRGGIRGHCLESLAAGASGSRLGMENVNSRPLLHRPEWFQFTYIFRNLYCFGVSRGTW